MCFWIDAHLAPQLASWLETQFSVEAKAVRDVGLRDAEDREIFEAARHAKVIVITKDKDFVEMVTRLGAPPQVLWLTCGNTTNKRLREIFEANWDQVAALLAEGEPLVEIADAP